MEKPNETLIPVYIEASSKQNLIQLMLYTNRVNSRSFNYQTPMKEGKKWVVWFFADLESTTIVQEKDLKKTITALGVIK
jgi:hypothetical protein